MKTQLYSDIFVNIFTYISGDSSPICKRHLESMLKGIKSYLCLVQTGNRICCRCTSGQVEDEIHYLLHCTCHANHREIFTTYLTSECQNLDDKCKLIWILNNEDPTILRYLCQYLLSTTIWLYRVIHHQSARDTLSRC
jgi:hypothetical protein